MSTEMMSQQAVAPWLRAVQKYPDLAAEAFEETGDFRVFRRFSLVNHLYSRPDPGAPVEYATPVAGGQLFRGVMLDTETTGLDPMTDEVISIAILPFEYDECGMILRVLPGEMYADMRNPFRPIPLEVQELTGITDEMVATAGDLDGKAIERAVFGGYADDPRDNAHRGYTQLPLIVAHQASFDRRLVERLTADVLRLKREPTTVGKLFATLPWACSRNEVPWVKLFPETPGTSVDGVLAGARRMYVDPEDRHSSVGDAHAVLHALATPIDGTQQAFSELFESSRRSTLRLEVFASPYEMKDRLKAAGFKGDLWATRRIWYKDYLSDLWGTRRISSKDYLRVNVSPDMALNADREWIEEAGGKTSVSTHSATERYSSRI